VDQVDLLHGGVAYRCGHRYDILVVIVAVIYTVSQKEMWCQTFCNNFIIC